MSSPDDPYSRVNYRRLIAWPERIQREAPFLREVFAAAPSPRLLDLGCGTGEHSRFLHAEGFDVTGVDSSLSMLASAREGEPGPAFVEGDLTRLGEAVTGPFGGALCLGNVLPHLTGDPELKAFLASLAALLLPGAKVLLQVLNYDRIHERRERVLPVNVRPGEDGAEVVFLRLMDPRPDGSVVFNPTTLRWRPLADPPVEVVSSKNVLLRGWREAELASHAEAAGFAVEGTFGGMRREPYERLGSSDTVLLLRRKEPVPGPEAG